MTAVATLFKTVSRYFSVLRFDINGKVQLELRMSFTLIYDFQLLVPAILWNFLFHRSKVTFWKGPFVNMFL